MTGVRRILNNAADTALATRHAEAWGSPSSLATLGEATSPPPRSRSSDTPKETLILGGVARFTPWT